MEKSARSNLVAIYLCYCLGMIGVHRFYVGKVITGILMIVTFGGLGIWWCVDLVRIIRENFKDDKGLTLKWDRPAPKEDEYNFAGFWIRGAALLIDALIMMLIFTPVMFLYIVFVFYEVAHHHVPGPFTSQIINVITLFLGISYFSYFHSSKNQATLGKKTVNIYVINAKGNRLSVPNAIGRAFATYLSGIAFYFGYIVAGITDKKRAWHDYIADTYVVYGKPDDVTDSKKAQYAAKLDVTPLKIKILCALPGIIVIGMYIILFVAMFALVSELKSDPKFVHQIYTKQMSDTDLDDKLNKAQNNRPASTKNELVSMIMSKMEGKAFDQKEFSRGYIEWETGYCVDQKYQSKIRKYSDEEIVAYCSCFESRKAHVFTMEEQKRAAAAGWDEKTVPDLLLKLRNIETTCNSEVIDLAK